MLGEEGRGGGTMWCPGGKGPGGWLGLDIGGRGEGGGGGWVGLEGGRESMPGRGGMVVIEGEGLEEEESVR